jgi:hypothetical protein
VYKVLLDLAVCIEVYNEERQDDVETAQSFRQTGKIIVVYLLVGDARCSLGRAGACKDGDRMVASCEGCAEELGCYVWRRVSGNRTERVGYVLPEPPATAMLTMIAIVLEYRDSVDR